MDYSAYLDPTKANRLFKKAFIYAIEDIYQKRLDNQNAFDELNFLIATDQVYAINNNQIYVHDLLIINVLNASTDWHIETELPHNLIVGDTVTLSGITGFVTNPNVTTTVTQVISSTIFHITTTASAGAYTGFVGQVTSPKIIADYYHYFYGKGKFTNLTNFTVVTATNSTPIRITTNNRTFFRDGDGVVIGGITGNTNTNGLRYLKQLNEKQYFLYSDAALSAAVSGNGTSGGTGTISQVLYSTLRFKRSDEKGAPFAQPSAYCPFYQQSKELIKILPTNVVCSELTLDYLRVPPRFIDVVDNVYDFDQWYSKNFQFDIINQAGKLFAQSLRDGGLLNVESQQIIEQE